MQNPVLDMPNSAYHKHPSISKSTLDLIAKDPYLVEWQKNCPQDDEKIDAFVFGDAFHALCLEPGRFESQFVVMPDFNLRTNAGKSERDAFLEENKDADILTADESKKLTLMYESVMAHPEARNILETNIEVEGSYFWTDKETGLDCRCRPDTRTASTIVDLKTTPDLAKFHFAVEDYRYYVQDPFYTDGIEAVLGEKFPFTFLVVQKTISAGRYPVSVVRLPHEVVEYGRLTYQRDLRKYRDFLENGKTEIDELVMHQRFLNMAEEEVTGEIYV